MRYTFFLGICLFGGIFLVCAAAKRAYASFTSEGDWEAYQGRITGFDARRAFAGERNRNGIIPVPIVEFQDAQGAHRTLGARMPSSFFGGRLKAGDRVTLRIDRHHPNHAKVETHPAWISIAGPLALGIGFLLGPVALLWRAGILQSGLASHEASGQEAPRGFTAYVDKLGRTVVESTGIGHGAHRKFITVFACIWTFTGVAAAQSIGTPLRGLLFGALFALTWMVILHATARMYFERLRIVFSPDWLELERGMPDLQSVARIPRSRISGIDISFEGTYRSSIKSYSVFVTADRRHTLASGLSLESSRWLLSKFDPLAGER